jgi:hypothetical protein
MRAGAVTHRIIEKVSFNTSSSMRVWFCRVPRYEMKIKSPHGAESRSLTARAQPGYAYRWAAQGLANRRRDSLQHPYVKAHRANLRRFGTTTAPRNRGGRQRSITPSMLEALLELLDEQSDLYLDELTEFLLVEYECRVSLPTISRTLKLSGWSKKNHVEEQRSKVKT